MKKIRRRSEKKPEECHGCVFFSLNSGWPYCPFMDCVRENIPQVSIRKRTVILV